MGTDDKYQCPPCIAGELRNSGIIGISRSVFWRAHPTTIRLLLALASFCWALSVYFNPGILSTRNYAYMLQVMPEPAWVAAFSAYAFGVFWRIYDTTPRVRWALAINVLGCLLWFTLTLCVNLHAGYFIPGSSLETVTCLFAAWVLVRTGLGKDVGTP